MMKNNLIVKLHHHIEPDDWPWVLIALRQDTLVWHSLESSDLGDKALSVLPTHGEIWTPAALALLALGNQFSPEGLTALPVDPVGEDAKHKADKVYENWVKSPASDDLSLEQIGWIALALRERRLLRASWNFLSTEVNNLGKASDTTLACLYGMIPDPFEFILAILQRNDRSASNLALHALLSNPLPAGNQALILKAISSQLTNSQFQGLLASLFTLRPELAATLANNWLSEHLERTSTDQVANQIVLYHGADERFNALSFHCMKAFFQQIASQPAGEISELDHALDATYKLQAYLIASKGAAYTRAKPRTSSPTPYAEINYEEAISAWREAAAMEPKDPFFSAGLALALLESENLEDARAALYLNQAKVPINICDDLKSLVQVNHQGTEQIDQWVSDPAWLAAAGLVSARAGQNDLARHYINSVLLHYENADEFRDFLTNLAQASLDLNMYLEAEKFCRLALNNGCSSSDLLPILSQVQLVLGQASEALNNTYLVCELRPGEVELHRLRIRCLASTEEWETAWMEQKQLMEKNDSVTTDEYLELADYALNAGNQSEAIQACQQALKLDVSDGRAYYLLGQVALASGDPQAGMENFLLAVQLAPHLPPTWIALANLYTAHGEYSKALETLHTGSRAAPDSPEIHLMIGSLLLNNRNLTQSLPYLRRAAALVYLDSSASLPAYRPMGKAIDNLRDKIGYALSEALRQLGYMDESRQLLENIFISDKRSVPPSLDVSYAYAHILMAFNKPDSALPILESIIRSQPDHPAAVMDYARSMVASRDQPAMAKAALPLLYELTQKEYNRTVLSGNISSVGHSPEEQAESYALLAEALKINGDAAGAIDAYREALGTSLIQDPAWRRRLTLGLAQVAMSAGWYETAATAYLEAIQIEPQASLYQNLSEAYEALILIEDAYLSACEVLRLCENQPELMVWFAEQSLALSNTIATPASFSQDLAIQSLITAIECLPPRATLVVLLGRLYLCNNDRVKAIQAFNSLTNICNDEIILKPDDLYQAAICLRELGEYVGAANLINKAIPLSQTESGRNLGIGTITYQQLLTELSNIYQLAGDPQSALHAIDSVIELSPCDLSNYYTKSRLHLELDQIGEAATCHEKALALDITNPNLHVQVALLKWLNGNLPGAFTNAKIATQLTAERPDIALHKTAVYLVAELSGAMLLAEQGIAILEVQPPGERPVEANYLLSEYYLEHNEVDRAAHALFEAAETLPQEAHTLAIQARLAARKNGLLETSKQLLKSAIENLPTSTDHINKEDNTALTAQDNFAYLIKRIRQASVFRGVSHAALELEDWETVKILLEQSAKLALPEARRYFEKARTLVLCAEAQRWCQALSIVQHAPGTAALSEASNQSCEMSISTAQELIQGFLSRVVMDLIPEGASANDSKDTETDTLVQGFKNVLQLIEYWATRGRLAFTPISENAERFLSIQESHADQMQNSAVVAGALGQTGRLGDAPAIVGLGLDHPQTSIHLSLALAESNRPQAIEVTRQALENLGRMELCTPGAEPSMYALLALISAYGESPTHAPNAALQSILSALSIWPDEPRWHTLAADLYLELNDQLDENHLSSALFHFKQACRLEPGYALHHMNLGLFYLDYIDAQKAILPLEQATEIDPTLSQAWLYLARSQKENGLLEKAFVSAERAVENNPSPLAAILIKGEIALMVGDPGIALSCSTAALRLQPDHQQALYIKARALEIQDKPDEALLALNRAISLNNDDIETQVARARLLVKTQSPEVSLSTLQDLANCYPNEPRLLAMLSECFVGVDQVDRAAKSAQLALQVGRDILDTQEQCQLHFLIGVQSRRAGQLDQAIFHLSEVMRKSPDFVDCYLELGKVYQERRQNSQAVEVFMAAAKIAPQDYRPYYLAGLALKDSRDYIEAETMLRHAAHLAPHEVSIHRQLGAVVALNLVHNRRLAPTDKVSL